MAWRYPEGGEKGKYASAAERRVDNKSKRTLDKRISREGLQPTTCVRSVDEGELGRGFAVHVTRAFRSQHVLRQVRLEQIHSH